VTSLLDIPPPCCGEGSVPLRPLTALCSPVGGKGRLVPMTWVSLLMTEKVEAPAQMPAHNWMSMPSCGGREGISVSGVSHRPEANCRNASFMYYSYRRNRNHQPRKRDNFIAFLSRQTMQWQHRFSPLIAWDSSDSTAEPKARQSLDPIPNREV
jgi:hypothetical protein